MSESQDLCARSFHFAVRIVKLCRVLDETPGASRTLAKQLLRSGTSVGSNIEEAHGSQSRADFHAKMCIATKEARETHYWLRVLTAAEILPLSRLADIADEANQLVAILTTIVKKTKRPDTDRD